MKIHHKLGATALLLSSCLIACSSEDEAEPDSSAGDGDGDGDGAGGGGAGAVDEEYECSDDQLSAAGGGGGAAPVACDAPTPPTTDIEIAGDYVDQFGFDVSITTTNFSGALLSYVDNEANYALAQTPEDGSFGPCGWNKFVWTESEGTLYYCQVAFGAESECAAEETDDPDAADLEAGCSGFAWSELGAE